ncbi:MAG TPA: Holliday junction resolvase RuvX [Rhodospirillales bacterium]|jgi:putative Holliday junction resolvase|nr:Holliday junction resolvase RuvX [Rhodospirillaceae bacterium]PPR58465.1 MAG: putative pre-16S rRNA nuclease [Alphaproteobacteria bacterium MarineAlpha3_Bin6]HHZ77327.1 Holliday junction resolvase RuvX [Rhodospirillales bacterium]HIA81228.1 Holliday junction resolvase RuvX [Rhodospirillales bacterium]HIB22246.1 Holliday junction resolvase RuvX [Rhodospirillales bacterium]|tara:strand:+ start:791 stop:1255 length:465 start_codon:yes stop_codon:yes gene_type:complete
MVFQSLSELIKYLPKKSRLLGLDVGRKTIGLAVSDSDMKIATTVGTIRRSKFTKDVKNLDAIITERQVNGLVLGLPISMDGNEGPACQSVRQFAVNLDNILEIGITFWDERLSTSAVERLLIKEADLSRNRRSEIIDKMAAAYILQGALDSLSS